MKTGALDLHGADVAEPRMTDGGRLLFPGLAPLYASMEGVGYAILRVGFGLTLFTHGLPKLLGVPHGSMANPMAGSTNLIANVLHMPFAPQLAYFVMLLETFGSLALAAGLLTRLVAPMFGVQMLAICFALGPTYPWIDRGIEYPIVLGLIALYVSFRGGGRFSADRLLGRQL
ncbi:DoxX family protein [Methylobacterium oryzisoli]|uniref:DoxX family protein n=1 Tax=Methylobacterium oryzisoli TaxID=3385502 RepID=UPI0038923B41